MHGFKPLINSIMVIIIYDELYIQYSKDQVKEPRHGVLTCFVVKRPNGLLHARLLMMVMPMLAHHIRSN